MPTLLLVCLLATAAAAQVVPYQLADAYVGPDFMSRWDFFTMPDPSNGHVEYVDEATALAEGLVRTSAATAYVGVDMASHTAGGKRHSVRIQSKATYNGGLFIFNVEHMPTGCGTWPAFWMFGEDPEHVWPHWGEYDIVETMHTNTKILTTLHTRSGCDQTGVMPGVDFKKSWDLGDSQTPASNCDVNARYQYQNQGCSQQGPEGSAGQPFNRRGGGTFAGEWDPLSGHIRTWFWPTALVPPDIAMQRPDPSSWGTPDSYFSLAPQICDPSHFRSMRLVLDINLCGDLGSAHFAEACPVQAETMTCEDFVSDPASMSEAFWFIRGLDIYQRGPASAVVVLGDGEPQARVSTMSGAIMVAAISMLLLALVAMIGGYFLWNYQAQDARARTHTGRSMSAESFATSDWSHWSGRKQSSGDWSDWSVPP